MKNKQIPSDPYAEGIQLLREVRDALTSRIVEKELYYDNADLKRLLNVSDSTLYRRRKANAIPYKKICGKIVYPQSYFKNAFRS